MSIEDRRHLLNFRGITRNRCDTQRENLQAAATDWGFSIPVAHSQYRGAAVSHVLIFVAQRFLEA
ncbi:hypothetical protein [Agrococcus sp. Ld7]|uniref:hypothetical protein n=1 Tax=Agrococcus sp. Ld7 TaxID=649148 RepID=UPI00386E8E0B